jgi:Helicase HerA, central domain
MRDEHKHFFVGTSTRSAAYLSLSARRRHLGVFGKTGMGKSTLLSNLAIRDLRAGHQRLLPLGAKVNIYDNGLLFIDPHGDTARFLLDFIPQDRTNDVIYFDATDRNYTPALNLFSDLPRACHGAAEAALVALFSHIFDLSQKETPRLLHYLRFSLLALMEAPGMTLAHLPYMLGTSERSERFRSWVLRSVTNQEVLDFWLDEYVNHGNRYNTEAAAPVLSRIKAFLSYPAVAHIIGQKHSTIDVRKAMDERQIIIANLSEGVIGEEATNLLGSLLMTKVHLATMSRADIASEDDRVDFPVIVDEFSKFTTSSFANILAEARKMRVNLTAATQFRSQIPVGIRDAVEGNVGGLICFQLGVDDAEHFGKSFGLGNMQVLTDLPPFTAYFKSIQRPGGRRVACPLGPKATRPRAHKVIGASRTNFMVPKAKARAEYRAIKELAFLDR